MVASWLLKKIADFPKKLLATKTKKQNSQLAPSNWI